MQKNLMGNRLFICLGWSKLALLALWTAFVCGLTGPASLKAEGNWLLGVGANGNVKGQWDWRVSSWNEHWIPVARVSGQDLVEVATGANHSLGINSTGRLVGRGSNALGELGLGNEVKVRDFTPLPIYGSAKATLVAAGPNFSIFAMSDGTLWAMGRNDIGQLGLGDFVDRKVPVKVPLAVGKVVRISCGNKHVLFLKANGELWGMGSNRYGQLGLKKDKSNLPVLLDVNVSRISAGGDHSLYLKGDGSVWAMGRNNHGQLGDGKKGVDRSTPKKIRHAGFVDVAAGGAHSCLLRSDGTLLVVGNNNHGQVGAGKDAQVIEEFVPVAKNVRSITAGKNGTLFLKTDGSVWGMGVWDSSANLPVRILKREYGVFSAVSGSTSAHVLFLAADNQALSVFPENGSALKTFLKGIVDIEVGPTFKLDNFNRSSSSRDNPPDGYVSWIDQNGNLKAIGQFPREKTRNGGHYETYRKSGGGYLIESSGSLGKAAVTDLDAADLGLFFIQKQWNNIWEPEVKVIAGDAVTPPRAMGSENRYKEVVDGLILFAPSSGAGGKLYLRKNSPKWTGKGDFRKNDYSFVVGANNVVAVSSAWNTPGDKNDPNGTYTYHGGLQAYPGHTIYLTSDGTVRGFGYNAYHQIGPGTGMTDRLITIPSSRGAKPIAVAAGYHHSVILMDDGTAWTLGLNSQGQRGDGSALNKGEIFATKVKLDAPVDAVWAGPRSSYFRTRDGALWVAGAISGSLGLAGGDKRFSLPRRAIGVDGKPLEGEVLKVDASFTSGRRSGVKTVILWRESFAPRNVSLAKMNGADDPGEGYVVGQLRTTGPDSSRHHTYVLVPGKNDNDKFFISGNLLKSKHKLDLASGDLKVRVRAIDSHGEFTNKDFTLSAESGADVSADISLDSTEVDEDAPPGTVVGNLSTADPIARAWHRYGLPGGIGFPDNSNFRIEKNQLVTYSDFNSQSKDTYVIRVRLKGAAGKVLEKTFRIRVKKQRGQPAFTPPGAPADYQAKWEKAEARVRELEAQLKAKNQSIASRDQKIARLTNDLASKDKQLNEKNKVIADLRAKLASVKKENDQWQEWGESLEQENAGLKESLAEAERIMKVPHTQDWYYVDGKGWLWTSPEYFPWIYSNKEKTWLRYKQGTSEPWLYFDYKTQEWQEWRLEPSS